VEILNNLAEVYLVQGEYGKAAPLYARALAIFEKILGAESPGTAGGLNNLARLYQAQGEYAKALPLYERALSIFEKEVGSKHATTKSVAVNLAAVREKLTAPSKP
jgi:tetratricopeptide (TPR) repeat protein